MYEFIAADFPIGKSDAAELWAFTFCYLSARTNEPYINRCSAFEKNLEDDKKLLE